MRDYDYSLPEPYFITICTYHHQSLFGAIEEGRLSLSPAGRMVASTWRDIPLVLPSVVLDEFIVMPDHFHAIFGLANPKDQVPIDVPRVVQCFKTLTMRGYKEGIETRGWPRYSRFLWQRGYWDRIIRNDAELEAHREYIYNNPLRTEPGLLP